MAISVSPPPATALGTSSDVDIDEIVCTSVVADGAAGIVASANGGKDTLALSDTTAGVGITIGGDTNLYRGDADRLDTDDTLRAANLQTAGNLATDTIANWGASMLTVSNNGGMTFSGSAPFIQIPESASDPAAPAANNARLYCKDNGGGKTQLVAIFPTGAVQVIATQP